MVSQRGTNVIYNSQTPCWDCVVDRQGRKRSMRREKKEEGGTSEQPQCRHGFGMAAYFLKERTGLHAHQQEPVGSSTS